MIFVWGARLGIYLLIRIHKMGGKDERFNKMRDTFSKIAIFWVLQAFTVWLVLLPVIFFMKNNTGDIGVLYVVIPAILIFTFGLVFESVADQ